MHPGAHPADRPAIIMAESGDVTTFGELEASANRIAHLFREIGLGVGDHVAFVVENRPEFLALCWGAQYAGLLYTACSTRLGVDELAYIVEDCGARALIMSARYADRVPPVDVAARFALGGEIEGFRSWEDTLARQPAERLAGDLVMGRDMLYSSGTTGRPKGIKPREQTARIDEPHMITPVLAGPLQISAGDIYLSPAPLYHAAPLRFCMSAHQIGATTVVMERFDAATCLEVIGRYGVTHGQFVPTMFVRMLKLPEEVRAAADVSTLKAVVHAAAPCPVEAKQQMLDWWGPIIFEYYASTEGAGLTWVTPQEWLDKPGTVGKSLIGVAHVVGPDGRELPPGETGTVYFSDGPEFEYHNAADKTAETHDERGWATVGDIGHLDEDGFLFLTDRASYMIITGGVNVYPQEAEDALLSHPAVYDAAVFGIPNEDFGEEVKAVVQPVEMPADDAAAGALEQELIAYTRSRLADVKCPRSIDFRADLPRHDTGKLYKRLLKDEYAARA